MKISARNVLKGKVKKVIHVEKMPQHTQFLLMNTTKSGDFYGEYSGVTLDSLL